MARRKRKRTFKKRKRRTIRRRRRRVGFRSNAYRLQAQPTKGLVQFRYVTYNIPVTSSVGAPSHYVFRANSPYDPDLSGVGHQPRGWDQWSIFFNYYCVVGSKIRVYATTDSIVQGACGIMLTDTGSAVGTMDDYIEQKRGRFAIISNDQRAIKMKYAYSARKFFSVKDPSSDDTLCAAMGANPFQGAFYNVWFQTNDASTEQIRLIVIIDYIVRFKEPAQIPIS